jgi:hypothetical protein
MRRLLVLAAFVPTTLLLANACGDDAPDEPPIQDLCGWVGDPANCYRTFAEDVGIRCGAFGRGTAARGSFKTRDALDTCILNVQNGAEYEGGQVVFEPALDLAALPPETQSFTFIKNDGTTCGTARFASKYDFSIAITGDPVPEGGTSEDLVEGGSYDQTGLEGRDVLDVTCPSGSEYYFDRLQITKCRQYEEILPHAEMDINPGAVGIPGVVRFRVFYPPVEGELADAAPYEVEYFECIIPPPPDPCEDGAQNGTETDVDCGGPDCGRKCDDDQKCTSDQDCRDGLTCRLVEGLKKCKE